MQKKLLSIMSHQDIDHTICMSLIDWQYLYPLLSYQGVTAIVWDKVQSAINKGELLKTQQPSSSLKIQWAINVERIEHKYAAQKLVIAKLASFFARYNIRMMILKGYGLSLNYPIPNHRPCGDIDIWLFEDVIMPNGDIKRISAQQKADNLLREHFQIPIDNDKHHHTVFYIDGVMVENHYDFFNIYAHRSNREIEAQLQKLILDEMEPVEIDDTKIFLPSPDFHALFLLRHSAAHFAAERIGLRHLLDWRYFIEKYASKIKWQELIDFAHKMNMDKFLHGINAICIDYLGLSNSCIPILQRNIRLERRILNEILNPEFSEPKPKNASYITSWSYMIRRWWANRWKHNIVYKEGLIETFFVQLWSHLLKPKSLRFH